MSRGQSIQSITRSLDVIERICSHSDGLGVTRLATDLGLAKATVHRILQALVERGYVIQDHRTGLYLAGNKILQLSRLIHTSLEPQHKVGRYVAELETVTGEHAYYAGIAHDGSSLVVCREAVAAKDVLVGSCLGKTLYLDERPDGSEKPLVAQLPEQERAYLLQSFGDRLKTTHAKELPAPPVDFKPDYLTAKDVMGDGITSIYSLVRDHTGGAVGILGVLALTYRTDAKAVEELGAKVAAVSAKASMAMGYSAG